MDARLTGLLDELYRAGREHDAAHDDRLARWRNLEPETAALLATIVRAMQPRAILELGTSNGYSTLWLADSSRDIAARFVSVELDPARSDAARANLTRAGLVDHADLRVADAADALRAGDDGAWELIFLDSERPAYPGYWPDLLRVLAPGGLLAVDNVLSHADEVLPFRALVAAEPTVSEALVPVGAGLLLVVKAGRRS